MVITLTGENEFACRQALDALIADFIAANGTHGLERTGAESADVSRLPDLLQGTSLFSPKRMVVLTQPAENKPLWDALADWAPKVDPDTTLVIVEPHPDKRTRTYKVLKTTGDFKEFALATDAELVRWLQQSAKAQGSELSPAAAQYVVHRAGREQWRLHQELQKLVNYPRITQELIDTLIEPTSEANAFALLDAALAGEHATIAKLVQQLRPTEDPYKFFGLLASQVHALALVTFAGSRSAETVAKDAGLHPFVVRKTQAAAKKMGPTRVKEIAAYVALCDYQLKSTGVDPWHLIETTLQKITQ